MDPIQAAIRYLESQKPGEQLPYRQIALKHGLNYTTLMRRYKSSPSSLATRSIKQQKFTLQQETKLVRYIESLKKRGFPPTKEATQSYALQIVQGPVGEE